MRDYRVRLLVAITLLAMLSLSSAAWSSHISGLRITQTGNTGLTVNVDITAFYTTGSTTSSAYLGTYYNAVPAIDWGDGSTTPRYGYGPSTGIPLAATSTVVNGIPARAYRGSFSHTYAGAGNYTISANTRCCPLTTPTYTLVSGSIVTTTVTTTGVFGPTTFTTSFVQNTLGIAMATPVFTKSFAPAITGVGIPTTLTYTIDNSASTQDANALDFTDNLPAGLTVASPANVTNTCTGGTVTATSGTAVISYTAGLVLAGATCTLAVDVQSASVGSFTSTSGDLTSAFGNSGSATATLDVVDTPIFTKSFSTPSVLENTVVTLVFMIDNSLNSVAATGLTFTDPFPLGMVVATAPNVVDTCGGTLVAPAGASSLSYSGGTVAAGAVCSVMVDVLVPRGSFVNVASSLASSLGTGPAGTASAPVVGRAAIPTTSFWGSAALVAMLTLLSLLVLRRAQG